MRRPSSEDRRLRGETLVAEIRCFMLEPTGRIQLWLRAYSDPNKPNVCQRARIHQAMVKIEAIDGPDRPDHGEYDEDPRWPQTCERCDYRFTAEDELQVFRQEEMRRSDTGELTNLRDAPVGAMWLAPWMSDPKFEGFYDGADHRKNRPGQPHLVVKTPAGDWDIDGQSSNNDHQGWTRTGEPPNVTARPSIGIGTPYRYHGFLTNGVLRDA